MASEQEPSSAAPVEAIHYYPKHRSLVIQVEGGLSFALLSSPEGIFYELLREGSITRRSVETLMAESEARAGDLPEPREMSPARAKERSPTTVIPGKLQSKPVEGRPDRHDKPTAYARLLGHLDGEEGATLLSTTFHGKTREIALGLHAEDNVTAQGYLHRSEDPDRLSTFSVIHLVHYPGKPPKGQS